tara:strand:+ start:1346 stop:2119 length:774 start_codon:yes stop_codon:yes gene_type:complete
VKSRKNSPQGQDKKKMTLRLNPTHHQTLKRLSEDKGKTMSLILEEMIEHYLLGNQMMVDRQAEIKRLDDNGSDFDQGVYQEAYTELEALLGFEWLEMTESSRKVMTYMALFPHHNDLQLQKLSGHDRHLVSRLKQSEIGVRVLNHFGDRYLWSRRPEVLRTVVDKALEGEDPAYTEQAMRLYNDYALNIKQENKNININIDTSKDSGVFSHQDLDQQLMTMAKRINMTPARYEKLWLNLEQKQLNSAEVIEAEVVND